MKISEMRHRNERMVQIIGEGRRKEKVKIKINKGGREVGGGRRQKRKTQKDKLQYKETTVDTVNLGRRTESFMRS
jgi:hypothetical protein